MAGGVQAVLDAGIYRTRHRDIALWRHIKLTPASIKRLWSTPESIDALRNLERRTGLYVDERELAQCYNTDATRLGLVEAVGYFAKLCPEMLVESPLPFEVAATGGCLETVQLLCAPALTACAMHQSLSYAMYHAAAGNNMEGFNWLSEQRPGYMSMFAVKELARHGHIAIFKQSWHDDPDLWSTDILNEATQGAFEGNQIETLNEPCNALDIAAGTGCLERVQWQHFHTSLPCTTAAMDQAASLGQVDILQFLHTHRSEGFSKYAMINAFIKHYPHTVTPEAMDLAVSDGKLQIVQLLHTECDTPCTPAAMDQASSSGHLDTLRWLHKHRSERCTGAAMERAAENDLLSLVLFLAEQGYPACLHDVFSHCSSYIVEGVGPRDNGEII
ncbi:hypothetical protein RI367_007659 [Sorochytrium milnesiophthora]